MNIDTYIIRNLRAFRSGYRAKRAEVLPLTFWGYVGRIALYTLVLTFGPIIIGPR